MNRRHPLLDRVTVRTLTTTSLQEVHAGTSANTLEGPSANYSGHMSNCDECPGHTDARTLSDPPCDP